MMTTHQLARLVKQSVHDGADAKSALQCLVELMGAEYTPRCLWKLRLVATFELHGFEASTWEGNYTLLHLWADCVLLTPEAQEARP